MKTGAVKPEHITRTKLTSLERAQKLIADLSNAERRALWDQLNQEFQTNYFEQQRSPDADCQSEERLSRINTRQTKNACAAGEAELGSNSSRVGRGNIAEQDHEQLTEAVLRERWPKVFNDARRPLKIGVHVDLKIGRDDATMHAWTKHPVYLRNLITGGARYDLDGRAVGSVSLDEQLHAQLELAQCVFQIKSRKCGGSS
jgi:hypothetical protein